MKFRCSLGFHDWEIRKTEYKDAIDYFTRNPGGGNISVSGSIRLYDRVCLICGKHEDQIATYTRLVRREMAEEVARKHKAEQLLRLKKKNDVETTGEKVPLFEDKKAFDFIDDEFLLEQELTECFKNCSVNRRSDAE